MEGGRLDEAATFLRCLGRLSTKADRGLAGADGGAPSDAGECGGGWIRGYRAVLDAVQELVRKRTGGASLALIC